MRGMTQLMRERANPVAGSPGVDGRSDLEQCVQATQRLGADPSLVLHGGGNSSVKTAWHDVTGHDVDAIYVKGTGRDMSTITARVPSSICSASERRQSITSAGVR